MIKRLKCPQCSTPFDEKIFVCTQCKLPLQFHKLFQYAKNLSMQWDRILYEDSLLLYEDELLRVSPKPLPQDEASSQRIVYYKNHRFVLLDFSTLIWKNKAIIHFKLRPEKGLILVYPREHPMANLFLEVLEIFAEDLEWELKDMRDVFDVQTSLEENIEKHKVILK